MDTQTQLDKYLVEEMGVTEPLLSMARNKIRKYNDIYDEFCYWLENRNFDKSDPLVVGGYTAKQIFELNPNFSGIGVYNFLIALRDEPEKAKRIIDEGFVDI